MMTNEAGKSIFSTYIELLDKFGVLTRAVTQVRSTETWEALKTATADVAGCLDDMARAAGFDLTAARNVCRCGHPITVHSGLGCMVYTNTTQRIFCECDKTHGYGGDYDIELVEKLDAERAELEKQQTTLTPSTQDGDGVTDAVHQE